MDNLTLLTCNYNTPDLIQNLLKSVKLHCPQIPKILVIDTGKPTLYSDMVEGAMYHTMEDETHGNGVNKGFELIQTDHVLLIDSDVLLYQDILPVYEKFKTGNFTLLGHVTGDRGGKKLYPRVDPWFCFINLKHLKEHDIKFFDPIRTKKSRSEDRVYDVGSTLFEDVMNKNLLIANVNLENKYFKHYEGMSWRIAKFDPTKEDTDVDFGGTHDNLELYSYGLRILNQYTADVVSLNQL
jgi:hypothetical protein